MDNIIIQIQRENFLPDEINKKLLSDELDIGALVCFTGICRSENGAVEFLQLEHYPEMAKQQLQKIANEACNRWQLDGLAIVHRYGKIFPSENIVLVTATAKHRAAAFAAAQFAMDYLKTEAPFWKKQKTAQGTKWIGEQQKDRAAIKNWQ